MKGEEEMKRKKRFLALMLSAALIAPLVSPGAGITAKANCVSGDAPFINTWLVAGPSDETIYGDAFGSIKRPVDGNWAKLAKASANSSVNGKIDGFYTGPDKAIDGVLTTMWATNPEDGVENKQLTISWNQDIQVKKLKMTGMVATASDTVSPAEVNVELFDRAGESLGSVKLTDLKDTTQDPVVYEFETAIEGVATIIVSPSAAEEDSDKYMGISAIQVFDGIEDSVDEGEPPAGVDKLNIIDAAANSTCREGGVGAEMAIDGNPDTAWKSRTHQMVAWDKNATLTLTLEDAALVTNLNFIPHEEKGTGKLTTIYRLLDSDKNILREGSVQCSGAKDDQKEIAFGSGIEGVKYITFSFEEIDGGLNHFGIREAEVLGLAGMRELTGITAEANSTCREQGVGAEMAIDGDLKTAWKSRTHQMVAWDKNATLTLTLENASLITNLIFTPHEEKGSGKFATIYRLLDSGKNILKEGSVECSGAEDDQKEIALSAEGVKYVTFSFEEIDGGLNHFGIREVKLIGMETGGSSEPDKQIDVTPRLGEAFGDSGSCWQYFDDRIFNRSYDDYNDLFGYFNIKQGIDVMDKNVYAHTYVYSPSEQDAQLQFASPGACKVFFNDVQVLVKSEKSGDNLSKNETKVDITLKQGWNKLLFELYNEPDSYILGLYARICQDSNKIEGLQYSVMGGETENNELTVATRGLNIDESAFRERNKDLPQNQYPENELPNGYTQWPYVWNKEIIDKGWDRATQSSKFQFQAGGGTPGYKWELAEGTLPPGLTLNEDGTIDGICTEEDGEYPFTVQVTDADGNTAVKETKIVVKVRPNKWLEEGGMSALSHCIGSYNLEIDENYSADTWAERAKNAGMTMVSIEAAFQTYYWPAPSYEYAKNLVDAKNLEEVDGKLQPKDALKPFVDAIHRYGMETGFYYGFSWGMPGANNLAAQDVQDLIVRYDPHYFFLDTNVNLNKNSDVRWSIIRSYNDYILLQHNLNASAGDNDLGLYEGPQYFYMPYVSGGTWVKNMLNHTYKYNVEEVWRHPVIKDFDAWSRYHNGMRDDWRMFAKAIIGDIGHGFVTNYDQQVIPERGEKYPQPIVGNNGGKSHLQLYPLSLQQPATMRENLNNWLRNDKGMDLRESLYGTFPYTFDYEKRGSNWQDDPELAFKYGEGPEWGYVVSRDQFVYMHMIENQISGKSKTGYTGQATVEAGPFDYEVTKVEWMNEGKELSFKPSTGKVDGKYYYTIDLNGVTADPIDTVLKITTADPERNFKLTGVKLFSSQNKDTQNKLQLRAESYLNNYTSVMAPAVLTYTSDNTAVATVDANGLVTAVAEGKANITVKAQYDGVTKTDTYPVAVKADGSIYADLPLVGAVLETDGYEVFGKFGTGRDLPLTLSGRTEKGGGIDLFHADDITWHCGTSNEKAQITETDLSDLFVIEDSQLKFTGTVAERTDVAIWADITIGENVYTTNKTYLWIYPEENLSAGIVPEASSGQDTAANVTDGIINDTDGTDTSKWTPDASDTDPSLVFDLGTDSQVDKITVFYNNWFVRYKNAPKAVQIQVSDDGKTWSEPITSDVGVPENGVTKYAWEDECYSYPVNANGRYVKLSFPGGAQGEQMDILEVRVMGPQPEREEPEEPKEDYTVTFLADGRLYAEKTAVLGESIEMPADPEKEGYTFLGWFDVEEGGSRVTVFDHTMTVYAQWKQNSAANKTLLQQTYEYASTLSTEDVVDSMVQRFEEAMKKAGEVLADPGATQEEIDEAWDNLLEGIWGLGIVRGDKTNLDLLIQKAESMIKNEDRYVTENWQQLVEALADAKAVYDDGDALDEDIEPAADALLKAILAQRFKANKSNLENLVNQAAAIDLSLYTEESACAFRVALMSARAVLADDTLSTDDQAAVDEAVKELEDAIAGLEKESDGDNADEDGNKENNSGNKDNTSGNNSGNTSGGNNSTSGNNNKTQTPKTGDEANIIIWAAMLLATVMIGTSVVRRKRQ